jgi:acylphosphatase
MQHIKEKAKMANENEGIKSVRLMVSGRVQGVGFRYYVKQVAAQHKIKGWIRNRDDGRMEIAAEAARQQVDAFSRKVGRGTFLARVEGVDSQLCEPQNYTAFEIKATT